MPNLHSLLNLNGNKLLPNLINLVASKHQWATNQEHLFHQGNKETPVLKILPNPTINQLGNGLVYFLQADGSFNAPKYSDPSFQSTVLNPDFRKAYKEWSSLNMSEANFQNPFHQAIFMLGFEQARRVETTGDVLSRKQIRSGISTVMGGTDQDYPEQVSRMLDILNNSMLALQAQGCQLIYLENKIFQKRAIKQKIRGDKKSKFNLVT